MASLYELAEQLRELGRTMREVADRLHLVGSLCERAAGALEQQARREVTPGPSDT